MYVNTSFGCRTQGQESTVGWFSALSPVRNFSTDSSVGTYWNSVFFYLISICTPSLPRILNLSLLISHCFPI